MEVSTNKLSDYALLCDATLNHNYTRVRVEDKLGRQEVNWNLYKRLEQDGNILLITAIDDKQLIGFAMYVTYVHPHHPDGKLGHCMFLIVPPQHRGKGLGKALVEYAMPQLKARGCTHILHNRRMAYDVVPLFPKLGFEKIEESYVKEL